MVHSKIYLDLSNFLFFENLSIAFRSQSSKHSDEINRILYEETVA